MLIKIIIIACMFSSRDDGDSLLLRKEAHLAATRWWVTGDGMAFVKDLRRTFPLRGGRGGRDEGGDVRVKQDIISLMSSPGLWFLFLCRVREAGAPAAEEKWEEKEEER